MVSTNSGISFIMKHPDNKLCFDCGISIFKLGSISPTMSSVNNGVLLCAKCGELHKSFSDNISYVKSLTDETWSDEEVMFLQVAGNKRFFNLMTEYRIPQGKNIDYKYSVIAADYHRKLVKNLIIFQIFAELNDLASPMKPEIHIGQKLISLYILEQKALAEKAKEPAKKGFFGKLDSVFTDVKNKISAGAQDLDNKYDLSGHGQKAVLFCKVASDKMNEKGREIAVNIFLNYQNNATVQEYSKKTTDGFNNMVNVTKKSLNIGQDEQQNNSNTNQNLNNQQQNNNQSNLTIQSNQSIDNSHNNQQSTSTIQSNSTVQSNQTDNKPKQI